MGINWTNSVDEASSQAKPTGKLILIDLFNPG
jgi:hypothetical protein